MRLQTPHLFLFRLVEKTDDLSVKRISMGFCKGSLGRALETYPATCFLRASSWSMIPAEVVRTMYPN
jgi:hypothetical protein